jgi:DNA-directed RNA polymerase subunit RPC12/RpoP
MSCKGICVKYRATKPRGSGRYASGQKRCQRCELFMRWQGLECPCCGFRLRMKPRGSYYKVKFKMITLPAE